MAGIKRKLTVEEQIAHMKHKGVQFRIMDEAAARDYLHYNSNYFKLAAYRKNYEKHPGGAHQGEYVRLDFAYLVDLATIDMELRYQIVQMALDIEHHAKIQLLRLVDNSAEDGYRIIADFIAQLSAGQRRILNDELQRNRANTYCGALIQKYEPNYPIWVFVELIPFGRLISLYKFCAERFGDETMLRTYYLLRDCRELRNASAHSNCILNDLHTGTSKPYRNAELTKAINAIAGIPPRFRKNRMGNERIRQIVTLLYVYKTMITSTAMLDREREKLMMLLARLHKHSEYYSENALLASSFRFLTLIIDNWFGLGYNEATR